VNGPETSPLLSVVTPVYNGGPFIAENVSIIRDELNAAGIPYELIVVSDGSVDETVERAVSAGHPDVRVLHYDRNIGKGYAVKVGLLAARGRFIGFIDSDLDLHPAELPSFLAAMQRGSLDAAIGSKRHPHSRVDYPPRRRLYSWLYQQLIRLLFRLDVADTQVGIKIFRRELVETVVPHLLVKRYAFDLELLAVARDSGFTRIAEQPVRLQYSFGGSGIAPLAIAQALLDTAAIFYRLRILRYYRRRRSIVGDGRGSARLTTTIAVVGAGDDPQALRTTLEAVHALEEKASRVVAELAAPRTEDDDVTARRLRALEDADTDLIAFLRPGSVPAANWLASLLPYFVNEEVVAVGGPLIPRAQGGVRTAAAAAMYESRFAAGPLARRHVPGNLRIARDQKVDNLLVRRSSAAESRAFAAAAAHRDDGDVARDLSRVGRVLFTPDAPVIVSMPSLIRPVLQTLHDHARARGRALAALRRAPLTVVAPTAATLTLATLPTLAFLPARARRGAGLAGGLYGIALAYAAVHAGLRHRSGRVALAFALVAPAGHLAYGSGVLRGSAEGVRGRRESGRATGHLDGRRSSAPDAAASARAGLRVERRC
jgi:glycosyltransferase involved in cell wall biosynthesis